MNRKALSFVAVFALVAASGCQTVVSPEDVRLADSHRDLAEAKLGMGEPEVAIKEYLAAIAIHPDDAESHYGLALAYQQKAMLPDTEREFKETLRIDPTHLEARLALGNTYLQMERWNDAALQFEMLVADPTFVRPTRALVNLGWAHYKSGNLERAKSDFERAIKQDRSNYVAHLDLGIVNYDQGDLVEAVTHFEACVNILAQRPVKVYGPVEAEARFRMAQAYVRLGKRDQALASLKVAVDRGGESEWVRKSTDYLKVLQ
jgi:Tfp pilus assembly protein PilF